MPLSFIHIVAYVGSFLFIGEWYSVGPTLNLKVKKLRSNEVAWLSQISVTGLWLLNLPSVDVKLYSDTGWWMSWPHPRWFCSGREIPTCNAQVTVGGASHTVWLSLSQTMKLDPCCFPALCCNLWDAATRPHTYFFGKMCALESWWLFQNYLSIYLFFSLNWPMSTFTSGSSPSRRSHHSHTELCG